MAQGSSNSKDEPETDIEDLEISIAHWHINAWGGAEYLVTKLAESLGIDTVYTLGRPDPSNPNPYGEISFVDVTPTLSYSWLRRLQQRADRIFEYAQWEDVDWREFGNPDIVITSGSTTRSVITPDDTLHVNYCHSPPRWFYDRYHDRKNSVSGKILRPLIRYLRMRDMTVDSRVDKYFVNSPIIKRRLWKYYKRDSTVLYPPIETTKYRDEGDGSYFLHLGRLDGEKGVPEIIDAFEKLEAKLVLAGGKGDIRDSVISRIKQVNNIEWRGFVDKEDKLELLANCRAVIFNGKNEDFGIVPIEALASNKPVLTRNEGFPHLIIDDGLNGYHHDGSSEGIRNSVDRIENDGVEKSNYPVDEFSFSKFEQKLKDVLQKQHFELTSFG